MTTEQEAINHILAPMLFFVFSSILIGGVYSIWTFNDWLSERRHK